ncbi:hypothetical protein ABZ897_28460 [Nonomuraea sp. NPDC046802]|uniref:hypothetical protein n=1 Tax=Nonomuraea sp. NPDC046802 TaxID=3154919 RepID=UPI0033FA827F
MNNQPPEPLRAARPPEIELSPDEATRSDDIVALIERTNPARISQVGQNYHGIAELCRLSVETLSKQSAEIVRTMGGESVQGMLKTIGELQRDLAKIYVAAESVSRPLVWYGDEVLPWFRRNIPRTGGMSWDDNLAEDIGMASQSNANILARHHLRLLNASIRDVYDAVENHLEQRATAPQIGNVSSPSLGGLGSSLGGLTGNPYAGSNLGSPQTPGFDGLTSPSGPDTPDFQSPGQPLPQDPALKDPSLKDPSLQSPPPQNPSLQTPQTPDLKNPSLDTPDLPKTPSTTDLSSLPQTNLPQTGLPQTGNPPGVPTGPWTASGSAQATPFGGAGSPGPGGAGSMGASGMPMGMMPPMGGAANGGQERERTRASLVEDEAFDSDDMGGPSVIA